MPRSGGNSPLLYGTLFQIYAVGFSNGYYRKLCHIARKSSDGIVQNLGYRHDVKKKAGHFKLYCKHSDNRDVASDDVCQGIFAAIEKKQS